MSASDTHPGGETAPAAVLAEPKQEVIIAASGTVGPQGTVQTGGGTAAKPTGGKTIIRIRQSSALPVRNPVRVVRTQRLVPAGQTAAAAGQPPVKVQRIAAEPATTTTTTAPETTAATAAAPVEVTVAAPPTAVEEEEGTEAQATAGGGRVAVLTAVDYEEEVTVDVVEALAQREAQEEAQLVSAAALDEELQSRPNTRQTSAAHTGSGGGGGNPSPRGKKSKQQSGRPYGRFAANTGPQPHLHKYVTYEEFNRQKAHIEGNAGMSREQKGKERKRIADSFEKQKKTLAARILSEQANQVVDLIAAHPEVLNEQMTQIILNTTANYFKDHYGKDIVEEAERLRNAVHTQPLPPEKEQ